jgi:hypothetical protein
MADCHDPSLLPFGTPPDSPDSTSLSSAMEQCARTLYRQAWEAYRTVGCPYGETDEAMLVWYSFQTNADEPTLASGRN